MIIINDLIRGYPRPRVEPICCFWLLNQFRGGWQWQFWCSFFYLFYNNMESNDIKGFLYGFLGKKKTTPEYSLRLTGRHICIVF